jgi:phytoene dehydrogenase-like protein
MHDVIIVGAGHNGLVCATLLARRGLDVLVLEEQRVVGGAVRTEYPFQKAPELGISSGAYLFGLMPPELVAELGLEVKLIRRDPHYFLPTTGSRYLLLGSDEHEARRQLVRFFSEEDYRANRALNDELDQLREDLAPAWLADPLSLEETAARYIRPALREVFVDLCRGRVIDYVDRFGFRSDLLRAMYCVTDGFSGVDAGWDSPGTGFNFLAHNMCRLPGSGGTWMIVEGGMGALARRLADLARAAGARIETGAAVARIDLAAGAVSGVTLADGRELRARVVAANADPFRTLDLVGRERLPGDYVARIDALRRDGTTFKVNLCLDALPRFTCLPEDRGQFGPTIHLLPDEEVVIAEVQRAYRDVKAGKLAAFPTIEWYIHSSVDPTLRDGAGRHNAALFVQWVPYELAGTTWEAEESRYVAHLLSICDRFAPGTSDRVVETFALTPPKIERHFGITRGHIQHVDNTIGFTDRAPYATPIAGLYLCGAGCHPAGSVNGAPGHNAAKKILRDLA